MKAAVDLYHVDSMPCRVQRWSVSLSKRSRDVIEMCELITWRCSTFYVAGASVNAIEVDHNFHHTNQR